MNFQTSTHKRDWLFTEDVLKQKYAEAQQQALAALAAQQAAADAGSGPADARQQQQQQPASPISLEDEALLKLYYQVKLKAIVQSQQLPSKVLASSLLFFKRFYSQASCLDHDPLRVMPTCIYLACKVEESYRSAETLCKQLGIDAGLVLRFEVPLLQGLKFDLVVHSPYRALAGLFQDFDRLRAQQSPLLDEQLLAAPSAALTAAHAKARAALDGLMLTDAPLLHPPGALAAAAMRAGLRGAAALPCGRFLRHVAARAAGAMAAQGGNAGGGGGSEGGGGDDAAEIERRHSQLLEVLAAVDALAAAAGQQQDEGALQARAAEVDRAIKLWKKGAAAGGGSQGAGAASATAGATAAATAGRPAAAGGGGAGALAAGQ